jgi:hypothetical protein
MQAPGRCEARGAGGLVHIGTRSRGPYVPTKTLRPVGRGLIVSYMSGHGYGAVKTCECANGLTPRLYASQRIQKPPFKKTGEIAASDNKQMPSNQSGARSNTASLRLNVRLCTFLKLLFGALVKGIFG